MKIHRVHNYSYDLRLNESLDSRNAEKMLHNRKKRRETMLWNRQYLWATEIMWVANQAIPDLCTRKVNIYGTMERTWVSSCSFLLKWMQGETIVDAILFCYLVEWATNYALGWHGYPMFMFRMFQASAKKSDSSFAFFLVVNRVFHHLNRILIHSHNDILFQSFTQEYHWLYAIRNDFYDFYKYHVS